MSFDIDISEEAGVRYLHFGSDWVQGAMRIARPWALELDYTREMMLSLLLRSSAAWPRRVLLIGLGAGSLTKFLHRHYPAARLTVVEIEARVVVAAQHHFRLPDEDERLQIQIDDGANFVMGKGPAYDLILVDGYDEDAKAGSLNSLPFYLNVQNRLSDKGILAVNLLGRSRGFRASVRHIEEAFPDRSLVLPPCASGNAIAFAAVGKPVSLDTATLRTRALALRETTGLNLAPTLDRYFQHFPDKDFAL